MRSKQLRIFPRQRRCVIGAEHLEPRRLLSYTLNTLAALNSSELSDPTSTLARDADGDLFFQATQGGASSENEAVCELSKGSNSPTVLGSFANERGDTGALVIDPAGDLFGLTNTGGANNNGTVWEIVAGSNSVTTLASFADAATGGDPALGYNLVLDASGNLFGTCQVGGSDNGGTVWELAKASSTIIPLASFQQSVTNKAVSGVVMDANGNLYGTIERDISVTGAYGAVWELPGGSGTINVLASFNGSNGNGPESPLYVDSNGDVFGESNAGGTGVSGTPNVGDGDLFEIPTGSNSITVLSSFTGPNGSGPSFGIAADSAGDIFGSARGGTNGQGVIYELPKGSSTIIAIQTFGSSTGPSPSTALLIDSNGDIFAGTPDQGAGGGGIVFELTPGGGGGGGGGSSSLAVALSAKVPSSVIAGQKVNLTPRLTISDTGSSSVTGNVTAKLFLSATTGVDSNSIQLASIAKSVKLKPHAHLLMNFKVPKLPASVPNGTYYLVAQTTDPSGNAVDAAVTATITIAPAEISLSGFFSKTPVPAKKGDSTLTFTVSDTGNSTASGNLGFDIYSSIDGLLADATAIRTSNKRINIKPGKSSRITTSVPLPAGTYYLVIQLDPSDTFNEVTLANTVFKSATALTVG